MFDLELLKTNNEQVHMTPSTDQPTDIVTQKAASSRPKTQRPRKDDRVFSTNGKSIPLGQFSIIMNAI